MAPLSCRARLRRRKRARGRPGRGSEAGGRPAWRWERLGDNRGGRSPVFGVTPEGRVPPAHGAVQLCAHPEIHWEGRGKGHDGTLHLRPPLGCPV